MSNSLTFPYGGLKGVLDAIGEELTELAGHRQTRLVANASAEDTSILVETTTDWEDSGRLYIDGEAYDYTGRVEVPAEFTGLQSPGFYLAGLKGDLPEGEVVVDGNRQFSGLDLARRMLFVETAEGGFLDTIGRNYGVNRPPGMSDDDFRGLIRILAYLPKGTIYAIEQVLDEFVGNGNYTIFEDLVGFPNRIFITLEGGLFINSEFRGKGYFNSQEAQPSTSATTVDVDFPPVGADLDAVYGVFLAPTTHRATFDGVLPSADTDVWTYVGTNVEGTSVTQNADGSYKLDDASAANNGPFYSRALRASGTTTIKAAWTMRLNTSTDDDACKVRLRDNNKVVEVGYDSAGPHVFMMDLTTRLGPNISIPAGFNDYRLEKIAVGNDPDDAVVRLFVNDELKHEEPITSFDNGFSDDVGFGALSTTGLSDSDWTEFVATTEDDVTNYWNGLELGDASTSSGDPDRIDSTGSNFDSTREIVGRRVRLTGAAGAHGRANGTYEITAVDAGGAFVDVQGVPHVESNGVDGLDVVDDDHVRIDPTWDNFTAEDAAVQAVLTTGTVPSNNAIDWTSFYGGDDGDNITVEFIDSPALPTVQVAVVNDGDGLEDIEVTLDVGVHTALDVITAVQGNPVAAALVNVASTEGSTGLGFPAALAATNLAGGEDGKTLVISGSGSGNDGSYVLANRIDALNALVGTHRTPAALTIEQNIDWRKDPNFPTEAGYDWESLATGGLAGQTLTLRRALPSASTDVVVLYTTVLSGQILEDEFIVNSSDAFYPLYLADPFAEVRAIIEAITVAGVIPLFGS